MFCACDQMQDLSDIGTYKQPLQEKRSSQVEWTPKKVKKKKNCFDDWGLRA